MKYLSLFSGIGGFELGIGPKHECIGFSEVDKYAIEIYQNHFPNHKNYGDITKIKTEELTDFDLLVGGFPCQSFSIAGQRRGFEDTRGTLFFEIARVLKTKQPRYFLVENVKGLLSHDDGKTFRTIITTLDELGYDLQWQVLNSKNFGVPQNRERVYIVGHLRGEPRPQVFPFTEDDCVSPRTNEAKGRQPQAEIASTLRDQKLRADQSYIIHNVYGGFKEKGVREFRDFSPTLRTPKGGGHIPTVVDLKSTPGSTRRGQFSEKGHTKTLDKQCHQAIIENSLIRKLTPTECERLQGFPDGWTAGVSDTQRYKTIGNAVTVNVIEAIMKKLSTFAIDS